MRKRICRFFNGVQVVHRRVQQAWCSSDITAFGDRRKCAIFAVLFI